jgi:hypothetical protein
MERYSGLRMIEISEKELQRQFRLLNQTISMHSLLRDKYKRRALILDIMLLICSIIFCATTFAGNELYSFFSISVANGKIVLGLASIIAFMAAIISLRVDWKGISAKHEDAVNKLSISLRLFRQYKNEDETWPDNISEQLNSSYWESMNNIVKIPDKYFNVLKVKHLRKVEISKLSDNLTGCPIFVIKILVLWESIKKAFKN